MLPLLRHSIDIGKTIEPLERFKVVAKIKVTPDLKEIMPITRILPVDDEESDERSFFRRYRVAMSVIAVVVVAVVLTIKLVAGTGSPPRRQSSLVVVSLPPPPPPPVQPPPPEAKMVDQQTFQPEEKPEEEPPKPPDQPPVGTNIKGDGTANAFGLGNSSGTGFGDRGSGTRFGWYAGQVQSIIGEALRNNRKTRNAEMTVRAHIWADASGRITRAQLAGSTGDAGLDAAVKDEVLIGLQLREPPPAGMPMPIVLRLTERRRN